MSDLGMDSNAMVSGQSGALRPTIASRDLAVRGARLHHAVHERAPVCLVPRLPAEIERRLADPTRARARPTPAPARGSRSGRPGAARSGVRTK